jgi:hypothetical protein
MSATMIFCSKCFKTLESEEELCSNCQNPTIPKRVYTVGEPKVMYDTPINSHVSSNMNSIPYNAKEKSV